MKYNNRTVPISKLEALTYCYLQALRSAAKTLPGSDQRAGAVDALTCLELRIRALNDEAAGMSETSMETKAA